MSKFTTLATNALYVGGGMVVGSLISSQIVEPNISSLELNSTVKAFVGPAVLVGVTFFAQDMLPKKVAYGMIGLAGYKAIQKTMGDTFPTQTSTA